MGTNVDGKRKVVLALTAIKGVGRRYANIVLKKADVDLTKRAGECTDEEVSSNWHPCFVCLMCVNTTRMLMLRVCLFCVGREVGHDHFEPASVQGAGLVPQQTKGHH